MIEWQSISKHVVLTLASTESIACACQQGANTAKRKNECGQG